MMAAHPAGMRRTMLRGQRLRKGSGVAPSPKTGLGLSMPKVLYDGRVVAISQDGGVIYDGEYSVTGDSIKASVRAYQINGWYFADADLEGAVGPSESMGLEFETTLGTESSVSLEYDAQYDQPSDTSMIEGLWRYGEPGYEAIVAIEDSGDFFAQDTDGCTYLGEARSLNPDKNLYSVDMGVIPVVHSMAPMPASRRCWMTQAWGRFCRLWFPIRMPLSSGPCSLWNDRLQHLRLA